MRFTMASKGRQLKDLINAPEIVVAPGVHEAFEEGDTAEVDFEASTVRNVTRGKSLAGRQTLPKLLELVKAGGIYPLLEKEGLIAPRAR
jgi:3-isopropylmalate/(R)-2-methylmalate dehydratase small subunit